MNATNPAVALSSVWTSLTENFIRRHSRLSANLLPVGGRGTRVNPDGTVTLAYGQGRNIAEITLSAASFNDLKAAVNSLGFQP